MEAEKNHKTPNPMPTLDEQKEWIRGALEPAKLNKMQYTIVEANMLSLIWRMDAQERQLDHFVKVLSITQGVKL